MYFVGAILAADVEYKSVNREMVVGSVEALVPVRMKLVHVKTDDEIIAAAGNRRVPRHFGRVVHRTVHDPEASVAPGYYVVEEVVGPKPPFDPEGRGGVLRRRL